MARPPRAAVPKKALYIGFGAGRDGTVRSSRAHGTGGPAPRSVPGPTPGPRVMSAAPFESPGEPVPTDGDGSVTVEVRVELKPGVMDAEAESIQKSLDLLGIRHVRHVRTARVYALQFADVDPTEAKRLADEAVDRLLANPVIHRVTVTSRPG